MSGFPLAQGNGHPNQNDGQPLPSGWIKEWDGNHNAWYFVDTRHNPPVTTWNDPRSIAPPAGPPPAEGTDRGLMGSIGHLVSGKPSTNNQNNDYSNNPYPQQAQPYGNYNQPGYQQNYSQHPPPQQFNGGLASSYYNQPPPQGAGYQPPPPANNATKPAASGGLGALLSKIPGGGGGAGGAAGGGPTALLSKLQIGRAHV